VGVTHFSVSYVLSRTIPLRFRHGTDPTSSARRQLHCNSKGCLFLCCERIWDLRPHGNKEWGVRLEISCPAVGNVLKFFMSRMKMDMCWWDFIFTLLFSHPQECHPELMFLLLKVWLYVWLSTFELGFWDTVYKNVIYWAYLNLGFRTLYKNASYWTYLDFWTLCTRMSFIEHIWILGQCVQECHLLSIFEFRFWDTVYIGMCISPIFSCVF
jgi:hypothetical protein